MPTASVTVTLATMARVGGVEALERRMRKGKTRAFFCFVLFAVEQSNAQLYSQGKVEKELSPLRPWQSHLADEVGGAGAGFGYKSSPGECWLLLF